MTFVICDFNGDGALVGGASLKAADFLSIMGWTASIKGVRAGD